MVTYAYICTHAYILLVMTCVYFMTPADRTEFILTLFLCHYIAWETGIASHTDVIGIKYIQIMQAFGLYVYKYNTKTTVKESM